MCGPALREILWRFLQWHSGLKAAEADGKANHGDLWVFIARHVHSPSVDVVPIML